jgi:hypothetical protein
MCRKGPDFSSADREEYFVFAQWVFDVRNDDIVGHARHREDSCYWIIILENLLLHLTSSNVDATIESVHDSFFCNYASADFILHNARVQQIQLLISDQD